MCIIKLILFLILLVIPPLAWASDNVYVKSLIFSGPSDKPEVSNRIASALENYRIKAIENPSPSLAGSLLKLAGIGERTGDDEGARRIASRFMAGATSIVFPVTDDIHLGALYNPYCDLMLILRLDPRPNETRILGGFISSGAMIAEANGVAASIAENTEVPQRIADRARALIDLIGKIDIRKLDISLLQHEQAMSVASRYQSLGQLYLSDTESNDLLVLSNMVAAGDIQSKNGVVLGTKVDSRIIPPYMRKRIKVVFAIGAAKNRTYFLSPIDNPTVALIFRGSFEGKKVIIWQVAVLSFLKSF